MSPDEMQQRLREALRAAMKAKDTVTVSALRSVLAAIANAEAIPVAVPASNAGLASNTGPASRAVTSGDQHVAGSAAGLGAAEARRRELTGADIAGIIGAEITERRGAARQYDSTGNAERASRLRREADIIESAGRALVLSSSHGRSRRFASAAAGAARALRRHPLRLATADRGAGEVTVVEPR